MHGIGGITFDFTGLTVVCNGARQHSILGLVHTSKTKIKAFFT